MPDNPSALALLDLDSSVMDTITERLFDEDARDASSLIEAMRTFTGAIFGMEEDLTAQTMEMRRSHLTLLVALIDDVRARLLDIFRAIDLDGRIPDADMLAPVHDGMTTAGEALAAIVTTLHTPRG